MHDVCWEHWIKITNLTSKSETAKHRLQRCPIGLATISASESNAFFACGHLACCMALTDQLTAVCQGTDIICWSFAAEELEEAEEGEQNRLNLTNARSEATYTSEQRS